MIPNIFGGRPDRGEPDYLMWALTGLLGAVAAVTLVILMLD